MKPCFASFGRCVAWSRPATPFRPVCPIRCTSADGHGFWEGERIAAESYASAACMPIRLVLDNVRSGQNVGACFRSGDAFRIEGLDLCGITCHPPHRDILKSALGSSGHVPWRPWDNTLDAVHSLQAEGWKVAAVEQADVSTWLPRVAPASTRNGPWCLATKCAACRQKCWTSATSCWRCLSTA